MATIIPCSTDRHLGDELENLWADFARSLRRRHRSPETTAVYRRSFVAFWRWALQQGITDPADVTPAAVNDWTDALLSTPLTNNGNPVSATDPMTGESVAATITPSTVRIRWSNLRPFFKWWAAEFDAPNPFTKAETPGLPKAPLVPVVPTADVRRLLGTCTGRDFTSVRDNAVIRVLFDTGIRRGEIVTMATDAWDRTNDLLAVTGKTGPRVVPVSASTGEALARYMRARNRHRHAGLGAFWLGPRGALGDSGIAQLLARRCDTAGLARINPHAFRHTWAHSFRERGGSEGDLLVLAGWTSPMMAHRYGRSAAAERAVESGRRYAPGDLLG